MRRLLLERLAAAQASRLVRRLAALVYQRGAALSHVDGLDIWGYPLLAGLIERSPIHVTKGSGPSVHQPGLQVHRRRGFERIPLCEVRPHGLVVVQPEQAIVESWALLPEYDRKAPMIVALRDRRLTPQQLSAALDRQPKLPGRRDMRGANIRSRSTAESSVWIATTRRR